MSPVPTLAADDPDAVEVAAAALHRGELLVVPTDTLYGLAVLPGHAEAVQRVFVAKDRPAHVQLPVLAGTLDQVRQLGVDVTPAAETLADQWWPGPLTMALAFADSTRPEWLIGRDEVAVRIPRHPFLLRLLASTGVLLVTSANRHGSATPRQAADAAAQLSPHVGLIVDGGPLTEVPSTLVNLRGSEAVVEREGVISRQDIDDAVRRTT